MQSKAKPFDDISNLFTNAAGALKGVGDEVKAMGRSQAERMIADMDLVTRDEFDVLKARLDAALAEIEALKGAGKAKPAAKKKAASTAKAKTSNRRAAPKKKTSAKTTAKKAPITKTRAKKA